MCNYIYKECDWLKDTHTHTYTHANVSVLQTKLCLRWFQLRDTDLFSSGAAICHPSAYTHEKQP